MTARYALDEITCGVCRDIGALRVLDSGDLLCLSCGAENGEDNRPRIPAGVTA